MQMAIGDKERQFGNAWHARPLHVHSKIEPLSAQMP